jgi:hypothetical protein
MTAKERAAENRHTRESGVIIRATCNLRDGHQWIGHHLGDFSPTDETRPRETWRRAYRLFRRCGKVNIIYVERARYTPELGSLYRAHDFAIYPDR